MKFIQYICNLFTGIEIVGYIIFTYSLLIADIAACVESLYFYSGSIYYRDYSRK